eukprot:ctg_1812.g693
MLWLVPPTPSTDLNYNVPFSGMTQSEEDAGLLQDVTVARAGMRQARRLAGAGRGRRGGAVAAAAGARAAGAVSGADGATRGGGEGVSVRVQVGSGAAARAAGGARVSVRGGVRTVHTGTVQAESRQCTAASRRGCGGGSGGGGDRMHAQAERGGAMVPRIIGHLSLSVHRMCAGLLVDVESERVLCELHPLVSLALSHTALGLAYWVAVQRAEAQQLSPLTLSRLSLGAAGTLRSAATQWTQVLHEPVPAMVQGVKLGSPPTSACYAAVELLQALCRARALYYRTVHLRAHETGGKGMRGLCVRLTEGAAEALAPDRLASWLRDGGDALPISSGLQSSLTAWRRRIDELRQRCWRDNDMVFMEVVPPSLPEWTDTDVVYPFERPPFVFPSAAAAAHSVVVNGMVATGQVAEHTIPSLQAMIATGSAKARR